MTLLARFGVLLVLVMTPAAALALPPVWTVRDHDSAIVIFGSVHLLPPGVAWRPPALEQALAKADDVWFETPMDVDGRAAAMRAAQAHAYLPEGRTLSQLLTATGRARLTKAALLLNAVPSQFDRLQPWYVDLMISQALYDKVGAKEAQGVEEQLWASVPPAARRHELETPEEQVGFFANAAMADQILSLEQTLKDAAHAERDYQILLKAWLGGDLATLEREVVRPMRKASPALYAALVQKRNANWVQAISARMQGSGRTVIIVGMGHLIGPDGLPAQLRAAGYEVDGPR